MRATSFAGIVLLGVGWCVACGGESRRAENRGNDANAGLGGSTAGVAANGGGRPTGATAGGGVGGVAGAMAGATCDWADRSQSTVCVRSCAEHVSYDQNLSCIEGKWGCGPDRMDVAECPPDSCARASDHVCCETDTGAQTAVTCSTEGPVEPCPAGSVDLPPRAKCAAASVTAEACAQLDQQPCAREGDRCGYVWVCSERCECKAAPDGLEWYCYTPLC